MEIEPEWLCGGGKRFPALWSAQFLSHVNRRAATDQRDSRGPMMQTQHDACDDRRNTGYLGDLSDKIQFRVCHLHSSATFPAALIQSRSGRGISITIRCGSSVIAAAPL